MLNQQFSSPLSYHDIHRTRRDLKKVLSIKRNLRKLRVVIREFDKSGILHIGYKSDYDKKMLLYQEKTNAYIELLVPSNPLTETFYKVVRLLNDLNSKKQIRVWQLKKMMPDHKKIELAYLYFLPKPHKVNCLGRYTIAVYCLIDDNADERHLQNVRSIHSPFIR